jgi:signal transduction histidine kinase
MAELLLVATGISAWLAVYNLVVFTIRRQRLSLWVGLWSLVSVVYQAGRHFELAGRTEWLPLLDQACFASALCLILLVALIVQEMTQSRDFPWLIKVLSAVLLAGWVLSLGSNLILADSLDSYVTSAGRTVVFTRVGPLYAPLLTGATLGALWFVVAMVRRSTSLSRREKGVWLFALGGYQLLGGNDVLLFSGVNRLLFPSLPGQTTFEFAAVALAVALSLRMARRSEFSQQELESLVLDRTQQLQGALSEARKAVEAKAAFLASMSHEVRTPLNGIIGLTQLMLDESLPPALEERLGLVLRSGQTLKALVDDVLDFSKLDARGLTISRGTFDPLATLQDVVALYEGNARSKGLRLSLEHHNVPAHVVGDEQRVRQIVSNLVNNAVKFTEHGGVTLTARATRETDQRAQLTISVADTGRGVSEADQARLFKPFSQVGVAMNAPGQGGTGLGLVISRELAQLMGGAITLTSAVGAGSTFTLGLAVDVSAWEAPPAALKASPSHARYEARVLVAEDNPINRLVTEGLLKSLGLEPTLVVDGAEAVRAASGGQFALVFMDCQMPQLDGFEATRQLRAVGYATPIIALTAFASNADRERCLASGMNDYLTKPLRRTDLDVVLARFLA